jgi:hypothetical protein
VAREKYRAETGCAALADQRGDSLVATAPPAQRWLLIESHTPWPRHALTALRRSTDLTRQPAPSTPKPDPPPGPESSTASGRESGAAVAPDAGTASGRESGAAVASDAGTASGRESGAVVTPGSGAAAGPGSGEALGMSAGAGEVMSALASRTDSSSAGVSLAWGEDERAGAGEELGVEVARRCRELGYRPVLIKRYGRVDHSAPRRWAAVDCRPGRESIRWGVLPSDEHVLEVLSGADRGVVSHEPIYLVCTHGRHDACCAVRGRPVAAALTAAYPDRTWECSHVGGDRFAANVVVLPHGLYYGHVPVTRAVELAKQYDEGFVVPDLLRGSGAFSPPVQAAQHFARAAGHFLAVNALRPTAVRRLPTNRWQIDLATHTAQDPDHPTQPPKHPTRQPGRASRQPEQAEDPSALSTRQPGQATTGSGQVGGVGGEVEWGPVITVEVSAWVEAVDAPLTCSSAPPGHVRRFRLNSLTTN